MHSCIKLVLAILFLVFNSCSNPIKMESIETIKIDVKANENEIEFNNYFASKNVVLLETNKNSIISKIDRISFHNNKIFILDKKLNSVFVFDRNGYFLFKIKNIGRGPQEYNSLMDFTIDEKNNNIILYTDRPYALFVYNMQGTFIKKLKLNDLYYNIASLNGEVILLNRDVERKNLLFNYDMSNNKEQGVLDISELDEIYKSNGIGRPFLTKDKNIHLSFPYSETIYEYSANGVNAKYYIDFGKHKIPKDIYKTKKNFRELFKFAKNNDYGYGICEFREYKDYVVFNFKITQTIVYSKKTNTAKKVSLINNDDRIYGSYIAHDGDDNNFVSICPARNFKTQMDIYKEGETWNKLPSHIKQMDNQISEYDNPLILIYTFK